MSMKAEEVWAAYMQAAMASITESGPVETAEIAASIADEALEKHKERWCREQSDER